MEKGWREEGEGGREEGWDWRRGRRHRQERCRIFGSRWAYFLCLCTLERSGREDGGEEGEGMGRRERLVQGEGIIAKNVAGFFDLDGIFSMLMYRWRGEGGMRDEGRRREKG
jgi:hypothetical protein